MTSKRDTAKRNRRIRNLAIQGYSRGQIANLVHMHVNSVAAILRSFVVRGELMEVANSSPRIYYDPRECAIEQTVDSDDENDGCVENIRDATEKGFCNSLPKEGLPLGWVNIHLTGSLVSMKIRRTGEFGSVRIPDSNIQGYWDDELPAGKGMRLRHFHIGLFGQKKIGAVYRIGNKGGQTFTVNPGRIYFDPKRISIAKAKELLIDRAKLIAGLLRSTGWQVTDPVIRTQANVRKNRNPEFEGIHIGKENDPLAEHIPSGVHDERNDITTDFSPGRMLCESELENITDERLVQVYANIPSALCSIEKNQAFLFTVLKRMDENLILLSSNVDRLMAASAGLAAQAVSQVQCSFPRFTGEGYQ